MHTFPQRSVSFFVGRFVILTLSFVSTTSHASAGPAYALSVSTRSNHSDARTLQGANLSGNAYVFTSNSANLQNLDPRGISKVCYWLDNPSRTGTAIHCDSYMPYDFAGSVDNTSASLAHPWHTNKVANGTHSITQLVTLSAGGSEVDTATFAVRNGTLTPSKNSLNFGTQTVNTTSPAQTVTLTNTGTGTVTFNSNGITISGNYADRSYCGASLAPAANCTISVTFAPTTTGTLTGTLSIASTATDPRLAVQLYGTGGAAGSLAANPSTLTFGSVQIGRNQTLSATLTNSGGSSVSVSQANVTGAGFSVSGLSLPLTLNPGQSVTFGVVFAPTSTGSASGSISVISNASNSTLTISLSGSGTAAGQFGVSPTILDFGSVVVGQSKSLTATLSATGSSVTVSSAATSTSEFALSGLSLPLTIPAGQSAPFTVTFTPQASGTASANATFVTNATTSPTLESLTGGGTTAPQHSVDLSWSPSTSSVVGYNVYRSGISGGPYTKINSVLDASTTYTDSSVQAGQTYFYVTRSVAGSGAESKYSNQVQAVVPSP